MEFVGRTLKKRFRGFGTFCGVVESYDSSSELFRIIYEDGDSEEMELGEVDSILKGIDMGEADEPVEKKRRGRKPKKQRRIDDGGAVRDGSGNSADSLVNDCCSGEGSEDNIIRDDLGRGGFSGKLEKECGLGGNLGESAFANGVLSERVCSDGLNPNVSFDENLKKNVYSDENWKGSDPAESVDRTQKVRFAFDLNSDSHEETEVDLNSSSLEEAKMENNISGGNLKNSTSFETTEATQMRNFDADGNPKEKTSLGAAEETQMEGGISNGSLKDEICGATKETQVKYRTGFGDHMMGNACLGMDERVQKEVADFGGKLERNALPEGLESTLGKEITFSMLQLEDPSSHADFAKKGIGNDLGCPNKEERSNKRRRLSENFKPTTETVLRRSTRRATVVFSSTNCVLSTEESHETNVPVVNSVSDGKPVGPDCGGLEEPSRLLPKLALPHSSESLNLDGIPILDLFSVYSCLRSFSALLFLSPFDLEVFAAAVKCKFANSLIDFIHFSILHTLKLHLEFLSSEGSESASACLRDLNWGLLDLITWPVFLVEYLLIHGSGLKPGFDLCQLKLLDGDYYKQPAAVKIEVLRCLCDDVIEAETIRLELNRRTLLSQLDMDIDRNASFEVYKKRKDPVDDSGGSCLTQEMVDDTNDWNSDECCLCKMDGSLICCDGCPAAYHSRCVGIAKDLLPEGEWYCPECVVGKRDLQRKSPRSLRGAELLGVDSYGRVYFGSCGYLLVSDSCDMDCSYYYYHRNDLGAVIEVLKSSESLYSEIIRAISMHWDIPFVLSGIKDHSDLQTLAVCTDVDMEEAKVSALHLSSTMCVSDIEEVKKEGIDEREPNGNGITTEGFGQLISESVSRVDSVTMNQFIKMANPFASSEGSADISQAAAGIQVSDKPEVDCSDKSVSTPVGFEIPEKLHFALGTLALQHVDHIKQETNLESTGHGCTSSLINQKEGMVAQMGYEPGCYVNYYSFAQIAASVAEELMCKPANNINDDPKGSAEEIISAQLKIISKKSLKFCWSNIVRLYINGLKEKCGWCFSCKNSSEGGDCLFNMNAPESHKTEAVGLCSKRNRKSHLIDLICQILSIEERLRGLLSGPWQSPHHIKLWRKSVLKACNVASLKHLLLTLESNLRRIALSVEWSKQVDSVATMGSASHVLATSVNVSLKQGISRKRARILDADSNSYSIAAAKSDFWWRGGKLSRQAFSWKVLPRSLASKGGRQAGCKKIPGIYYADGSELAKRSRYIAWRAALEMSTSVPQLALLVRELDSHIKWDELENNQILSQLSKEYRKLMRSFKKVTIRRKCVEGSQVKYLLDFGKRKTIPETVIRHGTMLEISSSERKKYWLDESHVPLNLLRAFEERKLVCKANKKSPEKLSDEGGRVMKASKKRGLSYLLSKCEVPENHQCGYCNKDLPVGEAVNCQCCKGFFHKRHVRKSDGSITADCMYTCHKCQDGKLKQTKIKMEKGKKRSQKGKKAPKGGLLVQSQDSKKATTEGRVLRPRNSKKVTIDARPVRSQNSRKFFTNRSPVDSRNSKKALTDRQLRSGKNKKVMRVGRPKRAVKKVKYASMQNKKLIGRKKGKRVQSLNGISIKSGKGICWHKRKRTKVYHAYWINGLRLSHKLNDERSILFKERKLILPSQISSTGNMQYKCCLCGEGEYTSTIVYIGCESCEDWFHGDAFGLTVEKLGSILGFRCHRCRQRNPPLCPHLQDPMVQVHEGRKEAEMQHDKDVSSIEFSPIGRDDEVKPPHEKSLGLLHMQTSIHELKADAIVDSDLIIVMDCSVESKGGHAFAKNDQKDEILDSKDMEQKVDADPDSNQTPVLECKTESEKTDVSDEFLVREGQPPCNFGENVIEKEGESLGKKVEAVFVEMTAISEMMLVAGTRGDSIELQEQKADAVTDSNRTLLWECEVESEKQHIVSGEFLVREGYPSCKSDEVITLGASLENNEMEDDSEEIIGSPEKVPVAGTPGDSSELHNATVLLSIEPLDTRENTV
ncbi:DDT domain-containing protein PTM-like [Macadamia integrifolia]|uniref:DDT domain-containing protein PTM-like n=1 Tax=Macadamia integrifolia TaxID=60698 RepID=UPI001C4FBBB2|nr:DDT domain-containing protein PTM-like [Macadamia integrifolia]XP_042515684.1 DDT domain-containing protein PTM-like [Macadamia integrifolia]